VQRRAGFLLKKQETMDKLCQSLIAPGLIDTPLKLQVLLLFYRHPRWRGDARRLSEWIHESPWLIEEVLNALVAAGFLASVVQHDHALYCLQPGLERWTTLVQFVRCYDDPLRREEIYTSVRAADRERQFLALAVGAGAGAYPVW